MSSSRKIMFYNILNGLINKFLIEKDNHRDLILKEKGLRVIHIRNEELNDIKRVKEKIVEYLYQNEFLIPPLCLV